MIPAMFQEVYARITEGNQRWNALDAPQSLLYPWDLSSTYVKSPPFFDGMVSVRVCECECEGWIVCVCV